MLKEEIHYKIIEEELKDPSIQQKIIDFQIVVGRSSLP
jgi:hypothetical protein